MDPTYQQMMIQALMGQGASPQGTTGQNPTTNYGANFITGNGTAIQQGMLGNSPPQTQQAAQLGYLMPQTQGQ